MPNFEMIVQILSELPPFEISTYLLLPTIFRKWQPLSFYWANVRQIPKNKRYLIWYILLTCKITDKYTVCVRRNWPCTICICFISKYRFWRPSWAPSLKKTRFEWSDFGRIFVFAAFICYTLEAESTNRYHLSLLRYLYFSCHRYGGYFNYRERNNL